MKQIKHIVLLTAGILLLQAICSAQCGVNFQDTLNKYCSGYYLIHYELSTDDANESNFVVEGGYSYSLYLLNPSHDFSDYQFFLDGVNISEAFSVVEKNRVMKLSIIADVTKEYSFSLAANSEEKVCVLMAIYYHPTADTETQPGIYRSFQEFKENNPSLDFAYVLKKRKIGGFGTNSVYQYRLKTNRSEREIIGEVFCFSDGMDVFVNITPRSKKLRASTRFAKIENLTSKGEDLKRFYYFEYYQQSYVSFGNEYGGTVITSLEKNVIDKNTGETISLTKSSLKKLLRDDPELWEEFQQESRKSTKLKDYLIRYIERNNGKQ